MMTTNRHIETHTLPLADELAPWFAGHENEYDMPAIYDDVRDELQDHLDRHGLGIISAWPPEHPADLWAPVTVDADQARDLLRQALEAVDLQTIAERHDPVRTTPLPACPDWCTASHVHGYEAVDGDGSWYGYHTTEVGNVHLDRPAGTLRVMLNQEVRRTPDGAVHVDQPFVTTLSTPDVDDAEFTQPATLQYLADAFQDAADRLADTLQDDEDHD